MATPKRKRDSSGEEVSRIVPELDVQIATVGIPAGLVEVQDMQILSGNVLRGKDGLRFSTGRRDGRAPEFSVADALRCDGTVRGPAGRRAR